MYMFVTECILLNQDNISLTDVRADRKHTDRHTDNAQMLFTECILLNQDNISPTD